MYSFDRKGIKKLKYFSKFGLEKEIEIVLHQHFIGRIWTKLKRSVMLKVREECNIKSADNPNYLRIGLI